MRRNVLPDNSLSGRNGGLGQRISSKFAPFFHLHRIHVPLNALFAIAVGALQPG